MRCVAQVEIDPFCRRVLAKHWPDVPRFEDVRTVTAADFTERVDVIAGGFPCQDISSAGDCVREGRGLDGERSGLWSEFRRLICDLRPPLVVVENVAALLVRGIDRILGELAESGYDAAWESLPAAAFGARHFRDRVFIVAASRVLDNSNKIAARSLTPNSEDRRRLSDAGIRHRIAGGPWSGEPGVSRVANGIPHRMDRCAALGNAVVPQIAEWIGRRIVAAAQIECAA